LLADAAGRFGKTARTPMLWIYTENDSYFAPSIARAMYHSFTAAGGVADFEQPGPYGLMVTDCSSGRAVLLSGVRSWRDISRSNTSSPDDRRLIIAAAPTRRARRTVVVGFTHQPIP
jgi:hypothetical protein